MSDPPLRFLVDQNVGRGVARALVKAGYDAAFAGDVDPHLSDAAILRWAEQENRLVITQDSDFGGLVFQTGQAHAGVLLLRMQASTRDERIQAVFWIVEQHGARLPGHFSVYADGRLRIR